MTNKIGLVTLYDYNYGSLLQCYALQSYIAKHYCDCELIVETRSSRSVSVLKQAITLACLCISHPRDAKCILRYFMSGRSGALNIDHDSLIEIKRFIRNHIKLRRSTWKDLITIGKGDDYAAFITGSDQVWNGYRVSGCGFYFLRFAPLSKRIGYATSFGGDSIARYNKSRFRHYITEFSNLSAREESGATLMRNMTGKSVVVLADPVFLLTAIDWRQCVSKLDSYERYNRITNKEYLLLIFLDTPSKAAIDAIKYIQRMSNIPAISFSYSYEVFSQLAEHTHINGTPLEFLLLIDHAKTVITDSFHVTAYSLIFHSEFFVYKRNYKHNQNQSNRITSLLSGMGVLNRFECGIPLLNKKIDFSSSDKYIQKLRLVSTEYLTNTLEQYGIKMKDNAEPIVSYEIDLATDRANCCGCGMCMEACSQFAIIMQMHVDGALYPRILSQKCIGCGVCVNKCPLKQKRHTAQCFGQKAYVGIGRNDALVSNSSSGGIFATLAVRILDKGGIVFGAAMVKDSDIECRHIAVRTKEELALIQGSKYVQSRTDGIFHVVKQVLETGKAVLFSGTSCQVAALYAYLGEPYENLTTVDLVCHGVPGNGLFADYIDYLERKYSCKVEYLKFRRKDTKCSEKMPFVLTIICRSIRGDLFEMAISLRDSAYYRLFMSCNGYREACYSCHYASLNKPADLTIADYYPDESEMTQITDIRGEKDQSSTYYSMILINSKQGRDILDECSADISRISIPLNVARSRHDNLRHASLPNNSKLWEIYKEGGFQALDKYIHKRNAVAKLGKTIICIVRKHKCIKIIEQ